MSESTVVGAEVVVDEDEDHTEARVKLELKGVAFAGWGRARRNPIDPNMPMVGEELAIGRAFSDLAHKLVDAAAEAITEREGRPADLRV